MKNYLDNFKSLSDKTELLESLEWDEAALEQLHSFINMQKDCFVPTHPVKLLEQIEEFFGEQTRKVVAKIFEREFKKIKGSKNEN
jgi:hypothetical protein